MSPPLSQAPRCWHDRHIVRGTALTAGLTRRDSNRLISKHSELSPTLPSTTSFLYSVNLLSHRSRSFSVVYADHCCRPREEVLVVCGVEGGEEELHVGRAARLHAEQGKVVHEQIHETSWKRKEIDIAFANEILGIE
jgi:hypothetical protein